MLYIRLYKDTGKYRAYYWSQGQHVYKDGYFDTIISCAEYFEAKDFEVHR